MPLQLRHPAATDEAAILAYKEAFFAQGDSMDGTAGLKDAPSFAQWFANWNSNLRAETALPNLVPATTFLAVDEADELVGMIDIRHRLNDHLLQFGGHIGYSVLPAQRRKGMATEMLRLALGECRTLGIGQVLITCDKANVASAKAIINNGGVLENEVPDGTRITQRYWIAL